MIRPTQPSVGHAWVLNIKQRNFGDTKTAQETLDKEVMPVAKGVGGGLFLVDHHHLLAALDLSGLDATVRVHMICRLPDATEDASWKELFQRGWAFPHSIPALVMQNFTEARRAPLRLLPSGSTLCRAFSHPLAPCGRSTSRSPLLRRRLCLGSCSSGRSTSLWPTIRGARSPVSRGNSTARRSRRATAAAALSRHMPSMPRR